MGSLSMCAPLSHDPIYLSSTTFEFIVIFVEIPFAVTGCLTFDSGGSWETEPHEIVAACPPAVAHLKKRICGGHLSSVYCAHKQARRTRIHRGNLPSGEWHDCTVGYPSLPLSAAIHPFSSSGEPLFFLPLSPRYRYMSRKETAAPGSG